MFLASGRGTSTFEQYSSIFLSMGSSGKPVSPRIPHTSRHVLGKFVMLGTGSFFRVVFFNLSDSTSVLKGFVELSIEVAISSRISDKTSCFNAAFISITIKGARRALNVLRSSAENVDMVATVGRWVEVCSPVCSRRP